MSATIVKWESNAELPFMSRGKSVRSSLIQSSQAKGIFELNERVIRIKSICDSWENFN